jgi:GNAT superfamily N-acetyltransferase
MIETGVTRAGPELADAIVDTVVAAFARDPAFRYFFPDDANYAADAGAYARYLVERRLPGGGVWVVEGGAAVALWDPPHELATGPRAATPAPPGLSATTWARLAEWDAVVAGLRPPTPHWYLGVLATHPDHAGRRLGRAVMAEGLRAAAAAGLPSYLETATDRNVGIYQRCGWTVDRTVTTGGLTVRFMRHS